MLGMRDLRLLAIALWGAHILYQTRSTADLCEWGEVDWIGPICDADAAEMGPPLARSAHLAYT